MSTIKEFEAANIVPPLRNTTGLVLKSQAAIVVSNAGVVQGLSGLFGASHKDSHFYTLQADGAKIYIQWAANDFGSIDSFATGSGVSICYPLADGVSMNVTPVGGREVGTGVATGSVAYNFIHARVSSGGVATAMLRIYRSSLAAGQTAEEFGG